MLERHNNIMHINTLIFVSKDCAEMKYSTVVGRWLCGVSSSNEGLKDAKFGACSSTGGSERSLLVIVDCVSFAFEFVRFIIG